MCLEPGEREKGTGAQGTGKVEYEAGPVETVTDPGYFL